MFATLTQHVNNQTLLYCFGKFEENMDLSYIHLAVLKSKGGSVEEQLYKKLHSTANLNFLFLSLFVYLLKNCSSQFFSN